MTIPYTVAKRLMESPNQWTFAEAKRDVSLLKTLKMIAVIKYRVDW